MPTTYLPACLLPTVRATYLGKKFGAFPPASARLRQSPRALAALEKKLAHVPSGPLLRLSPWSAGASSSERARRSPPLLQPGRPPIPSQISGLSDSGRPENNLKFVDSACFCVGWWGAGGFPVLVSRSRHLLIRPPSSAFTCSARLGSSRHRLMRFVDSAGGLWAHTLRLRASVVEFCVLWTHLECCGLGG